ncbi:UDP-2,3-diacylglucosamine diphosphatase [Vandammella animalimorsus]|uniref:UDP-2,3-diacylglucosamine hydrolase n=1 Tax=Vandammella animalimorsus TaxID=2029117 RepID=A0A2A2AAD2_9BURK|nr:UDP-2,3-diacylglucosamine diphosphatase [Vandammella animalimorsus]PAT34721.1 UDP-2,3-diacylglucosamine diphosphatase [Vandammella animalimorsus]
MAPASPPTPATVPALPPQIGQLRLPLPPQGAAPLVIDCVADMHLQRSQPGTWAAFAHYLRHTPAQHVLLLGDVFEVWVGDDALREPGSFEAEAAQLLRACTQAGKALYLMHGNRDFMIGQGFAQATGVQLLPDPCVLQLGSSPDAPRWLLSHGDALCTDDLPYQQFRAMSRQPQWQQHFLAQPLAARRTLASHIRSESEQRKQGQDSSNYVDLNPAATCQWLQHSSCATLIHGHTHCPGEHALGQGLARIVLSDWDADAQPPRLQALRLRSDQGLHWTRIDLSTAASTAANDHDNTAAP